MSLINEVSFYLFVWLFVVQNIEKQKSNKDITSQNEAEIGENLPGHVKSCLFIPFTNLFFWRMSREEIRHRETVIFLN